jgi:hypothetical protein
MTNIRQYGLEAEKECKANPAYESAKLAFLRKTCEEQTNGRENIAFLINLTENEMFNFFDCKTHPVANLIYKIDAPCPENYVQQSSSTIDHHIINSCLGLEYPTAVEYLDTYTCSNTGLCDESLGYCINVR